MPEPPSNFVSTHPLDPDDVPIVAAMRAATRAIKGASAGVEARGLYDALMEGVLARDDVTFERDTVGGISGVWVHPATWQSDDALLHLHGGWFNFGSAWAYRHLVAQLAGRSQVRAFVPDYRLAPEHPFPAAADDVLACYHGLAEKRVRRAVVSGDSAGGNLALGLAARVSAEAGANVTIVGVAALSPVTDITLSGASYETRADADPLFTRPQVAALVHSYLGNADPRDPLASPLGARLSGMPPICIHVGDDEVLLDDSLRFVERAVAARVDARADVWIGMAHGFPINVGKLKAAGQALDAIGAFIAQRLQTSA
jgi:acetyl esterase/lipase